MIKKIISIFEKLFGRCDRCKEWFVYPKRRRMNTAYEHEESNWICECDMCFEQTEAYWEEMWKDYYRSCI